MSKDNFVQLNKKIVSYLADNLSLRGRLDEKDQEINKLKKEVSTQKSRNTKLTNEKKSLKEELESLQEALNKKK
jgi:chromosome segregation ATPase